MNGAPTERFTTRARAYAAYRPGYAVGAVDEVLRGLDGATDDGADGVRWGGRALDVGAGTGIFSRLLAGRGVEVVGVEPNEAMRSMAEACAGVTLVDGVAEATGVEAGGFGLVVCAQAFHWFDAAAAFVEFARVLARPGRVALVWNARVSDGGFIDGYRALIGRHPGTSGVSTRWRADTDVLALMRGAYGNARSAVFEHGDRLDLEGVLGRAMSASYVPNRGWARERFEGELALLFGEHATRDGDGVERVSWAHETGVFVSEVG